MKSGQVTIKDLAKHLNISIATVSRALRNLPDVSPQTKKSVLELASQLDYQPNSIAQSLVKSRSQVIGVIIPDIATHFFSSSISGIQEVVSPANYSVMICQSNEKYETETKNIQALVSRRVDGLIISVSRETKDNNHIRQIHEKGIPLVLFDRVCEDLDVSKVVTDDYKGSFLAVEYLIKNGYRRIAYIAGPQNLILGKERLRGYLDALKKYTLPVEEDLIVYSDFIPEKVRSETKKLLDLPVIPEVIFTSNDLVAIEVVCIIKERGLKIPQDISVVGFGNEPITPLIDPPLTTVVQYPLEMGKIAAKVLLCQIENPSLHKPEIKVIKPDLAVRQSCLNKLLNL